MTAAPRFPIEVFDRLESTNDSLHRAAGSGVPEGTTHIAREQTSGRGRGDHDWWSPAGAGLWMSTLLRPTRTRAEWGGLALVVGAACRAALEDLDVRGVELYWPNDLYVSDRKLGGILCEARGADSSRWVVVGIGINIDLTPPDLRHAMPTELQDAAICMTEAGPPRVREPRALAIAILTRLWPLYRHFERGGALPRLVGEDLAHRGRRVEVLMPGQPPFHGIVAGLTDRGELVVRDLSDNEHVIRAAEVRYEH